MFSTCQGGPKRIATLGPPRWGLGANNITRIPGLRDVRYSSHRSTLGWYRAAPLGNAVKDFYPLKNGGIARLTLGSNPQRPEMTSIPHRPRVGGKMIEG